jgi:hypothetical protein
MAIPIEPIFDRHRIGMIIDISSESLSTSVRNAYRHRPESTAGFDDGVDFLRDGSLRAGLI